MRRLIVFFANALVHLEQSYKDFPYPKGKRVCDVLKAYEEYAIGKLDSEDGSYDKNAEITKEALKSILGYFDTCCSFHVLYEKERMLYDALESKPLGYSHVFGVEHLCRFFGVCSCLLKNV